MPTDCDIHSHLDTGIRCPSCGNDEWTEEKSPFMINPTKLGEEIEQEDVIDIIQAGVRNLDEIGPETLVRIHLYSYLVENSEIRSGFPPQAVVTSAHRSSSTSAPTISLMKGVDSALVKGGASITWQ